jgi:putative endonuclease
MIKWYVYILKSLKHGGYYIGYTSDKEERLIKHNAGNSRSTKSGIPWYMIYTEEYKTKSEAIKREKYIKRQKNKKYIESLINIDCHSGGRPD